MLEYVEVPRLSDHPNWGASVMLSLLGAEFHSERSWDIAFENVMEGKIRRREKDQNGHFVIEDIGHVDEEIATALVDALCYSIDEDAMDKDLVDVFMNSGRSVYNAEMFRIWNKDPKEISALFK